MPLASVCPRRTSVGWRGGWSQPALRAWLLGEDPTMAGSGCPHTLHRPHGSFAGRSPEANPEANRECNPNPERNPNPEPNLEHNLGTDLEHNLEPNLEPQPGTLP